MYTKSFKTTSLILGPGQTTDVLITADQVPARYYMAARAYQSAKNAPFDNTTATAILEYKSAPCSSKTSISPVPISATLPAYNDTTTVTAFTSQLRSPSNVNIPTEIDENLFFTVGLGFINCNPGPTCQGPNNTRFAASMNNVSFVLPSRVSLLQAYYQNIPGIFTSDFPPVPPVRFDYTNNVSRSLWQPTFGTRLYKLKFGSRVQIVLQDTAISTTEDHPIHLHGYQFYVVARGFGNFNQERDASNFNLVDPPQRNTINVPVGGWSVIRFVADNPGTYSNVLKIMLHECANIHCSIKLWFISLSGHNRSLADALPHRFPSYMGFGHELFGWGWRRWITVVSASSSRSTSMLKLRKRQTFL